MADKRPSMSDLVATVQRTIRRLRRHAVANGGAYAALGAVGWMMAAIALDLLIVLPVPGRVAVAAVLWAVVVAGLVAGLIRPIVSRIDPRVVALRIEGVAGGMHNRLLTVLDLASGRRSGEQDPALTARLVDQTTTRMAGFDPAWVIDARGLRKRGVLLAALVVGALVALVIAPDAVRTAAARILQPTAEIAPVSWVSFTTPGDIDVLRGETAEIESAVTRGSLEQMTLELRAGEDSDWVRYPMRKTAEGRFASPLDGLTADHQYRLRGGGTWTETHAIRIVDRPTIVDTRGRVLLPAYMDRPEPIEFDRDAPRVAVPIGSTVELAAVVEGRVARGELIAYRVERAEETVTRENEVVWFDDDTPADADTGGARWRWTTERAVSGARSHTPGWESPTYGFTTRLNRLDVPDRAALICYVWLDDADPPEAIEIAWSSGTRRFVLRWGPEDFIAPPAARAGFDTSADSWLMRTIGPLPTAGAWVRLEAPIDQIDGAVADGFSADGVWFSSYGGSAWFDRVGYLTRTTESSQAERLIERDRVAMSLDATGAWVGRVPVAEDARLTLRFVNESGIAGAPWRMLPIDAIEDVAPVIQIDRPAEDLVISEHAVVPFVGFAVDDWALASVGIEVGDSPEGLSGARWVEDLAEPVTEHRVSTTVNTESEGLGPGQGLYVRLVARDRAGLIGASAVRRITLVGDEGSRERTARQPGALDGLMDGLSRLLDLPAQIGEAAGDLAESILPDGAAAEATGDAPTGVEPQDGAGESLVEELDDDQRELSRRLSERMAEYHRRAAEMAERLERAARQAQQSPLSMDGEAEALGDIARRAEDLARQAEQAAAQDPADTAEASAQSEAGEQIAERHPDQLQQLAEDLDDLQRARNAVAQDPGEAQRQIEQMLIRMQTEAAATRLGALGRHLDRQSREVSDLSERQRQLNDATAEDVEANQQALDADAQRTLDRIDAVLQDAPLGDSRAPSADSETGGRQPSDASPLAQHQGRQAQRLANAEGRLGNARQRSDDMQSRATQLSQMMRQGQRGGQQGSSSSQGEGQGQGQGQGEGQGQGQGSGSGGGSASQQAEQLLQSPQMQQMLAMARRAAALDARARGEGSGERRGSGSGRGRPGAISDGSRSPFTMETELRVNPVYRALDPSMRARLYRLPDAVRRPLLQGMNERGPEGYESIIDAYYQQLSRDVE